MHYQPNSIFAYYCLKEFNEILVQVNEILITVLHPNNQVAQQDNFC